MSPTERADPSHKPSERRTSFVAALVQIGAAAVALAAVIGWLYVRGAREEEISHHLERARVLARPDNPRDLSAALGELEKVFQLAPEHAEAHALAAELEAERAVDLGIVEARRRADAHLAAAVAESSVAEERYVAEALLAIADGKAAEVPPRIEALIRSGAHSPRFWEVLGRAHVASGDTDRGFEELGRALSELGPSPRLLTAIGEAALADMHFEAAADAFNQVLSSYPNHLRARVDLTLTRLYVKDALTEAWKDQLALAQRQPELEGVLAARVLSAKAELALIQDQLTGALPLATEAARQGPGDLFTEVTLARVAEANGTRYLEAPEAPQWAAALWLGQARSQAEGRLGRWEEAAARVERFEHARFEHAHERAELLRQVSLNGMLTARGASVEATARLKAATVPASAQTRGATSSASYVVDRAGDTAFTLPVCILLAETARGQLAQKPAVAAELYRQAIRAAKAVDTPAGDLAKLREQVKLDLEAAGHPELATVAAEP